MDFRRRPNPLVLGPLLLLEVGQQVPEDKHIACVSRAARSYYCYRPTHLALARLTLSILTAACIMELCLPPHLAAVRFREMALVTEIASLFTARRCSSDMANNNACFDGGFCTAGFGAGAGAAGAGGGAGGGAR